MFNVYIAPVPSHIVGICGWPLALRPGGHLARRMHPHNYRGSRDSMPVVAARAAVRRFRASRGAVNARRLVHSHRDQAQP